MEKSNNRPIIFGLILTAGALSGIALFIFYQASVLFKEFVDFTNHQKVGVAYTIPDLPKTIEEVQSECSLGECIGLCLSHVNTLIDRGKINVSDLPEDDIYLVYYRVKDDDLVEPRIPKVRNDFIPLQENIDSHLVIWNYFKALFPPEARPDLIQYVVYISSKSSGMFDHTATGEWILYYDLFNSQDAYELTETLVHEYGHYLTLNKTQQVPSLNEICRQKTVYRCPTPGSYLNLFYEKFWKDIYPEWYEANHGATGSDRAMEKFYNKYQEKFINEYSSTHPIEDIAESWMYFVLAPTPAGNTVPEQKIKFFYDFPELVQLRYQIIKGICSYH